MADDIVWEICRNHYMIVKCPYISDWRNTMIIQESRAQVDLQEATENVKLCNRDHYMQTKGWIAPPADGPTNQAET